MSISSPRHLPVTEPRYLHLWSFLSGGESMSIPGFLAQARRHLAVGVSLFAIVANLGVPLPAAAQNHDRERETNTTTPIKHVIVIIGENRTFDHIFATYQPTSSDTRPGESRKA